MSASQTENFMREIASRLKDAKVYVDLQGEEFALERGWIESNQLEESREKLAKEASRVRELQDSVYAWRRAHSREFESFIQTLEQELAAHAAELKRDERSKFSDLNAKTLGDLRAGMLDWAQSPSPNAAAFRVWENLFEYLDRARNLKQRKN